MSDTIYSIGHGTKYLKDFIKQVAEAGVRTIVDVRTIPYSKHNPQFNRETLKTALVENGIEYLFRGKNLGGKGDNWQYDETITEVADLTRGSDHKIAVMCSETDYKRCHRHQMLQPDFERAGLQMEHIGYNKAGGGGISLFSLL